MEARKLIRTVFYSVLFCLVMEFEINVLLQKNIGSMFGVVLLYSFIGVLTHYTFPYILKFFSNQKKGFWVAVFAHGIAGLLIIEWGFMHNSPEALQAANTAKGEASIPFIFLLYLQLGMIAWWSTIATMPYMLQQQEGLVYKKKIMRIYGVYALLTLPLTIVYGMAPVIVLVQPFYFSFFYFYNKFGRTITQQN